MAYWQFRAALCCIFLYTTRFSITIQATADTQVIDARQPDAVIWALKRYYVFFSLHHGKHFLASKTPAYYAPPVEGTANEKLNVTMLFGNHWLGEIWTMFADYHAEKLYYTDHRTNFIGIYDFKSKQRRQVFNGLSWGIDSIGVDWVSGNIYWTDTNYHWIMVSDRNFSRYKHIISLKSNMPSRMAVHPLNRHLYWSERYDDRSLIVRSDLNGNNTRIIHQLSVDIITCLSIDFANDRLYWSELLKGESKTSAIRFCDLKDANHTIYDVYTSQKSYFECVASYKNHLYVTDSTAKQLFVISKETNKVIFRHKFYDHEYVRSVTVFSDPAPNVTYQSVCANNSCDHLCIAKPISGYTCECSVGFTLGPDGRTCDTEFVYDDFAIVVDAKHSRLVQIDMNSPKEPRLINADSVKKPSSVDYDWNSQALYWSDHSTRSIWKYHLKEKVQREIVNNSHVDSIALDVVSQNLYYADSEKTALLVTNLEGKYTYTLHIDHVYRVYAIAIDRVRGYLYWTDWGQSDPKGTETSGVIRCSRLDGSGVKTVAESTVTPHGIALDPTNNRLFWTEVQENTIRWINLTGSTTAGVYSIPMTNQSKKSHPNDLAFRKDRVYVTDKYLKHILSIDTESVLKNETASPHGVEPFGPSIFFEAVSIHMYSKSEMLKINGSNVCANSTCPHLCLPSYINDTFVPKCVCQDHFKYFASNNSCVQQISINDTTPPTFGNTCPDDFDVIAVECDEEANVTFDRPNATDDSGMPVRVKEMIKVPQLPARFSKGTHSFHFVATDKHHNKAECRFKVNVIARKCFPPFSLLTIFHSANLKQPTCGDRVGSIINGTCPGSTDVAFKLKCEINGRWVSDGPQTCSKPPKPTRSTIPTTEQSVIETTSSFETQETVKASSTSKYPLTTGTGSESVSVPEYHGTIQGQPQSSKGGNTGLVAGIVVAVLLVIIGGTVVVFLYRRRRGVRFLPAISNWRRSDDRVYLTGDNAPSDATFF